MDNSSSTKLEHIRQMLEHFKDKDKSIFNNPIFHLISNKNINKEFTTVCQWQKLEELVDHLECHSWTSETEYHKYIIPYVGDYITTVQITNHSDKIEIVKLKCNNSLDFCIGTYTLNPGNNLIIPIYGNPGLMVHLCTPFNFYFESSVNLDINVLWNYDDNKNLRKMKYYLENNDLFFMGPQGDIFHHKIFECTMSKIPYLE